MRTYQKKPKKVQAVKYIKGMEDAWRVLFSGNMFDYYKDFETEQEAINFIQNNGGYNFVDQDDKKYEIIYEDPYPLIEIECGLEEIDEHYYIFKDDNGLHVMHEEYFEKEFELCE